MAASVSSIEPPGSAPTTRLPWKWILEKLVDLSDFGVAFINEVITTHVTDIEEPHCRPLLERVALRNLEEMVVTNQIDSDAIPLLKALTGQDLGPVTTASSVKQRFNKELVLRVQTEVVLSVLRKDEDDGEKDWAHYASELESVFAEEEDNRLLDRKRELSALLKPKNQTEARVATYLEKYSLNKLRNDLYTFIDEKRESFKTKLLDQLSCDFLDANGALFFEELGDVEKSMKVDADARQDNVGTVDVESLQTLTDTHINGDVSLQGGGANPKLDETGNRHDVSETGDQQNLLGTATVSGKKRLRRKLLPAQDDFGDDESEVQECNGQTKKPRKGSPTSIVNSSKALFQQDVSGRAKSLFSPPNDSFPVKHGVESSKQPSSLERGEEGVSAHRNFGSEVMRSGIPPLHASFSSGETKLPPKEPSRTQKYIIISDVESDAETQVVQRLSTDDKEDDPMDNCEGDDHLKKGAQSTKKGSDQGQPQEILTAEIVRKKTIVVQSERRILEDKRIEASTCSPEAQIAQQGDNKKPMTRNESLPVDTQDMYAVDLFEVGSDGNEEVCHKCGLEGHLHCCDGCPISMHFKCIEILGLRLPRDGEDWYCPVCSSLKAAREAAEAEKAAAEAKEKLKAFIKESIKKQNSSEGDAMHHSRQKKAVKQPSSSKNTLQSENLKRDLQQPQQQSEAKPKPRNTEVQQDSDPPRTSLLPTFVRKSLNLKRLVNPFNQLSEEDSEDKGKDSLPEDNSPLERVSSFRQGEDGENLNDARGYVGRAVQVNEQLLNASPKSLVKDEVGSIPEKPRKCVSCNGDVEKSQKVQPYHFQDVSRRKQFAASTNGHIRKENKPFTRSSKTKFDSAEQEAGVQEPGSGGGEVEGHKHDDDLDEDRGGKSKVLKRGAYSSGRRRVPGVRRKHLPWTREEEDALKEGVKRFSVDGLYGFQWKRILEFGNGRFDPTRTDVDLKDKWRNLVKGVLCT